MNTEITNVVDAADDSAQYDKQAKRLLAQKSILAHILVKTLNEFRGMDPHDVVSYIEGEPYVSSVPVEPGLTNIEIERSTSDKQRIVGLNTENSEINEGVINFDIIFYVRMRDGLTQIIINVEAQKDEPTKYSILNRAIFYVSRMISSQKERDFSRSDYDSIKRVVSIWICMNMESNSLSHIHLTKEDELEPYSWKGNLDLIHIVMIGVKKELSEQNEKYELHRLIGALLSEKLEISDKLSILEHEYKIPVDDGIRNEVDIMCNLSQGIAERAAEKATAIATEKATEKATERFIQNMHENKFTLEQMALATGKTIKEIEAILQKK